MASPSTFSIAVLATVDPVVRDTVAGMALLERPRTLVVAHDITPGPQGPRLRRRTYDADGVVEQTVVELEHVCPGCAIREDAVPTVAAARADGRWDAVVLALPTGAEILPASRTLTAACGPGGDLAGAHLGATVAALEPAALPNDVFGDDALVDRGLALGDADPRAVGEAVLAQLCSADVVLLADGDAGVPADLGLGLDLVDALRAPGSRRVEDPYSPWLVEALGLAHDDLETERRLDPVTYEPGLRAPDLHDRTRGLWFLDLRSDRPFHPERMLANVERLTAGSQVGRGRFWVPNRPDAVCGWEAVGGSLTVGVAGPWEDDPAETRLMIHGLGPWREDIVRAFRESLVTDAELADAAAWLEADDPLEPFLGSPADLYRA